MPRRKKLDRILIVEDDSIIALSLEQALREAGARHVSIAATSEQALVELREHKPDAIILDVQLADRSDGWSIAELVDVIGPRPPRIVFSTGNPESIPEDIARLGAVLQKPYSNEALFDALCGGEKPRFLARLR